MFSRFVAAVALTAVGILAWGAHGEPATAVDPGAKGKLTINITAGAHWLRHGNGEAVAPGEGPQVALWLEDPAGDFVSTIYVTRRAAIEDWIGVAGAPEGGLVTPRPLPVWAGEHRGIGLEPMASCGACHGKRRSDDKTTAGDPVLEALTGPASTDGFSREWAVPDRIDPGVYGVRAEINHWMDANEKYADDLPMSDPDYSGGASGSGQPSVVWGGVIEIGASVDVCDLVVIGHGHPAGANGEVDVDLAALTTALSIADTIRVTYVPAN